jgi:hypothetical protein
MFITGAQTLQAGRSTVPCAKVVILLSTYNGERFLPAQLTSFLDQTHEDWLLYWRDDGSVDGSVQIMRDFVAKAGAERCIESPSSGMHLGASPSFFTLLAENPSAEAVAFSDQDDVWLPEKLAHALNMLSQADTSPTLYCARQYRVNEKLQGAKLSASYSKAPGFPAGLTQNIANGNTLVMNAAAATLVAGMGLPEDAIHDWWSYIVVSACGGQVIFDETPQILYRLHGDNLIAKAQPFLKRALAAFKRGPQVYITMMHRHTNALAAHASQLSPKAREDLRLVQSGLQGGKLRRLNALLCPRFRRRTFLENLLFGYWFVTTAPLGVKPEPASATYMVHAGEPG